MHTPSSLEFCVKEKKISLKEWDGKYVQYASFLVFNLG